MAGYPKPVIKPGTFHRKWWLKLQREKRINPVNGLYIMNSHNGKNRIGYVEYLCAEFPSFLQECYRHVTKVLGVQETAQNLCLSMNKYAKDKYSECEIHGNLNMTKWHFWKFFFCHGGKLKRLITKPCLKKEHIKAR